MTKWLRYTMKTVAPGDILFTVVMVLTTKPRGGGCHFLPTRWVLILDVEW